MMTNEWEERYQAGSMGWDRGRVSENLDYWIDNELLKPCRILIPGCGNGYEVTTLANLEFDVVAIDFAPTPIDNLQNRLDESNLTANLVLDDFFKWHPEEKFDAIFEQTSLCALPPEKWQAYEAMLSQWLKPQGKLFAQFMQTGKSGGPPFHCGINNMGELFPEQRWLWSNEYTSLEKEPGNIELLYILENIKAQ